MADPKLAPPRTASTSDSSSKEVENTSGWLGTFDNDHEAHVKFKPRGPLEAIREASWDDESEPETPGWTTYEWNDKDEDTGAIDLNTSILSTSDLLSDDKSFVRTNYGIYTALIDTKNVLRSIACDELGLQEREKFEKCTKNEMLWARAIVFMSDGRWEKARICVERKELREESCEPKEKMTWR
jgi:hypothetical protein